MDAILAAYNSGSEGSDGENGSGYGDDGTDAQAKRQKTIGSLPSPALSFYNYFSPSIVEIPGAVTPQQRTVTQGACQILISRTFFDRQFCFSRHSLSTFERSLRRSTVSSSSRHLLLRYLEEFISALVQFQCCDQFREPHLFWTLWRVCVLIAIQILCQFKFHSESSSVTFV